LIGCAAADGRSLVSRRAGELRECSSRWREEALGRIRVVLDRGRSHERQIDTTFVLH
jgi:hypothetical protein